MEKKIDKDVIEGSSSHLFQQHIQKCNVKLLKQIRAGNFYKVKSVIESGAVVNYKDSWGDSALHISAAYGRADICKFLCQKGALVNMENQVLVCPNLKKCIESTITSRAHFSFFSNRWVLVQLMLRLSADVMTL